MKKLINLIVLFLTITFVGCDPVRHVSHKSHKKKYIPLNNGSYAYHDNSRDVWFYIWLYSINSGSGYSSPTVQYVERSTYSPSGRGLTVDKTENVIEKEGAGELKAEETVQEGEIASEIGSETEIQSWENEGGSINNDVEVEVNENGTEVESSSSDDNSSSDSGSSDSGSSDSGGGDSGGGDSGGGE